MAYMDKYIEETSEWKKRRSKNVGLRKEIQSITKVEMEECLKNTKGILEDIVYGHKECDRNEAFKNERLRQKLYLKIIHHPFTEEQTLCAQKLVAEVNLDSLRLTKREEDSYRFLVLEPEFLLLLFKSKTAVEGNKAAEQLISETPFSDDSDLDISEKEAFGGVRSQDLVAQQKE